MIVFRRPTLFSLALAGVLIGFGPTEARAQSSNPGAPGGDGRGAGAFLAEYYAEVITRVGERMTVWRAAWRGDDLPTLVDSYWEEAQILFPGHSPVIGQLAIQQFFTELLPEVGEMQTSMIDFDASGRMGFVSGPFYYDVPQQGASPERIEGTHMTVLLRKGRDWKIRSQIFRLHVEPDASGPPLDR